MSVRLDFCPRSMAEFFCVRDHYSGGPPAGRMQTIGVWEDGSPVGALIFSRGACKDLAKWIGFDQTEAVEFTRCAVAPHRTPTTRIVAIALRLLKKGNPGLQVVISFSDPAQSHNGHQHDGTIYRAGNWMFLGMTHAESLVRIGGELRHPRTVGSKFHTRSIVWLKANVDPQAERVVVPPKFRFAMPLTGEARARLRPFVQPYPKCGGSRDSAAPGLLPGEDRAIRISPLHSSEVAHVG